jgi:hypothetical protein
LKRQPDSSDAESSQDIWRGSGRHEGTNHLRNMREIRRLVTPNVERSNAWIWLEL